MFILLAWQGHIHEITSKQMMSYVCIRHCSFNLGNISSETYYNLFSETLQKVLEGIGEQYETVDYCIPPISGPPPDDNHTTTDYINLLFAVNDLNVCKNVMSFCRSKTSTILTCKKFLN